MKKPEELKKLTNINGGCIASNRITVDGKKVGYAYREEQDDGFSGDTGWRFFAGDEDEEYINNPDNFNVFDINTICNYDEAILSILAAGVGEAFERNEEQNKLVRIDDEFGKN